MLTTRPRSCLYFWPLPFAKAAVAYHAAAAALLQPADCNSLIVEKATAVAKDAAMLIVHIALQADLLPSQQVVDRRMVDMTVADQVAGGTLCSVMQRVASLTESDGKMKDFVALARSASGVGGPELEASRPADCIPSNSERRSVVTPFVLIAATHPGPALDSDFTFAGMTPAPGSSRSSPAGTCIPFAGKRTESPSTWKGRAGAFGRRFSSSSTPHSPVSSLLVPGSVVRTSRIVRSLVVDTPYHSGVPGGESLSASSLSDARRSKPGLGERLDFDEIEPGGVEASAVERITGQDRKVGGTGISNVIARSATAAQALETVISGDLGGADVIASRAAPRSSRTATAAKALAADTTADAGVGDVVAPRAVQRSTGTATAAKTLAADTSAELGDGDVVASLPASPSTWMGTAAKALAADTSAVFWW